MKGAKGKRAIVIGGGIGGLAAAGRLKKEGFDVTLLEKNSHTGGRCDVIERDGHRFDVGPSFVLVPDAFDETFNALGHSLSSHLEMVRIDPSYAIYFGKAGKADREPLYMSSNLALMQKQLEQIEPGSFASYLRYLQEGQVNLHVTLKEIAHRNFTSWWQYFNPLKIPVLFQVHALKTHYRHISSFFKNEDLKAAFTFQNMYIGLSPYEAPATFSLLQYTELCDGVWFPMGGLFKIITSLDSIVRELGVNVQLNSPVAKINIAQNRATGVTLKDGRVIEADVIIANADLPYVYKELLPDKDLAEKLMKKKFTSSTISFYWGVDKVYEKLKHHNMFVASHRYRESFDDIFYKLSLPEEPSFYINCPSRTDPSAAPKGHDTFMVLVPVGHLSDEVKQDWPALVKRARKTVLDRLAKSDVGITDLESHIKFEIVYTPQEWKDLYNVEKGSTFGLNHQFTQVGYLRPGNKHEKYENLYFAGCSTHPGSGLPNVLVSSRLTVQRILSDLGLTSQNQTPSENRKHLFPPVPSKGMKNSALKNLLSSLMYWLVVLLALVAIAIYFDLGLTQICHYAQIQ